MMSNINNNSRRIRTPNYSSEEKILFMKLISNYKTILECKKTDGTTCREKDEAWEQITEQFNASGSTKTYRTKESLKKLYENKKTEIRKRAAIQKEQGLQNGSALTDYNNETLTGLYNEYNDGDSFIESSGTYDSEEDHKPDINILNSAVNNFQVSVECGVDSTNVPEGDYKVDVTNNIDWENASKNIESQVTNKLTRLSARRTPAKNRYWASRRIQGLNRGAGTNYLTKKYTEIAELEKEFYRHEIELSIQRGQREQEEHALRKQREEEEFALRKRSLLLDIEMKELQIKKLKNHI